MNLEGTVFSRLEPHLFSRCTIILQAFPDGMRALRGRSILLSSVCLKLNVPRCRSLNLLNSISYVRFLGSRLPAHQCLTSQKCRLSGDLEIVLWEPDVKVMCPLTICKQSNLIEYLMYLSACLTKLNCDHSMVDCYSQVDRDHFWRTQ